MAVVGLLFATGIRQHHFVIRTASADNMAFALLLGGGFSGIFKVIYITHRPNYEFIALDAMKEIHADFVRRDGSRTR